MKFQWRPCIIFQVLSSLTLCSYFLYFSHSNPHNTLPVDSQHLLMRAGKGREEKETWWEIIQFNCVIEEYRWLPFIINLQWDELKFSICPAVDDEKCLELMRCEEAFCYFSIVPPSDCKHFPLNFSLFSLFSLNMSFHPWKSCTWVRRKVISRNVWRQFPQILLRWLAVCFGSYHDFGFLTSVDGDESKSESKSFWIESSWNLLNRNFLLSIFSQEQLNNMKEKWFIRKLLKLLRRWKFSKTNVYGQKIPGHCPKST